MLEICNNSYDDNSPVSKEIEFFRDGFVGGKTLKLNSNLFLFIHSD